MPAFLWTIIALAAWCWFSRNFSKSLERLLSFYISFIQFFIGFLNQFYLSQRKLFEKIQRISGSHERMPCELPMKPSLDWMVWAWWIDCLKLDSTCWFLFEAVNMFACFLSISHGKIINSNYDYPLRANAAQNCLNYFWSVFCGSNFNFFVVHQNLAMFQSQLILLMV